MSPEKIDPLSDIETIDTELALADLATVDKALARYRKPAQSGDKEAKLLVAVLEKVQAQLKPGRTGALACSFEGGTGQHQAVVPDYCQAGAVCRQRRRARIRRRQCAAAAGKAARRQ